MREDKTLLFHDKIIKTGKGESKFAIRYNLGFCSPYKGSQWDYNAKSVSCHQGIFCVALEYLFKGWKINPYILEMRSDEWAIKHLKLLLLEYTEDDALFKTQYEMAVRQCNIVFICDNMLTMVRMFNERIVIDRFLKEKEAAEYNTYF